MSGRVVALVDWCSPAVPQCIETLRYSLSAREKIRMSWQAGNKAACAVRLFVEQYNK